MKRISVVGIGILMGVMVIPFARALPSVSQEPVTIPLSEDSQVAVNLSNKDINRIFVLNDKIVSFNAPDNRLIAHNDASGSVFMNVSGKDTFVVFITTEMDRHFSLLITPKDESGATIKFVPKTLAPIDYSNHSLQAMNFESSSPYEKTLIHLLTDVMRGDTPPGYSEIPSSGFVKIAVTDLPRHPQGLKKLSQRVESLFLGGELVVLVLLVTNHSQEMLPLKDNDFYLPGVRAIAIASTHLGPNQSTEVYEVVSHV